MANIDHVKLLCRGVNAWNEQRAQHPFVPDLSHVDIRNAKLPRVRLEQANFDGAVIANVDLREADLTEARINGATVTHTSLCWASLVNAELKGTDFKRAELTNAVLDKIESFDLKIRHSGLQKASFRGSTLRSAHFYNCDLTGACFAEATADHVVVKRAWIEEEQRIALEQMGFSFDLVNQPDREKWVDWNKFEVDRNTENYGLIVHEGRAFWIGEGRWDFFISHATSDKELVARPLANALRRLEQIVWYDELMIDPGDNLSDIIQFGAEASLFGVLIISPEFFGRRWTEAEINALQRKRLFLVLHGIDAEELGILRPDLADCFYLSTRLGIDHIAERLVAASRKPPQ
jgi:uncharacterized protein YjbI with pentapeptide repeats